MNEYLFEDRPVSSFQRIAASSNADVIVFGHTHRPYTKLVDNVLFVNAGSVDDFDRRLRPGGVGKNSGGSFMCR